MAKYTLDKYRNIGIMAHIDAGKRLLQKEFYITQVKVIKSVKYMMVLQQWTGWNKNKKEALLSPPPQQLVFGEITELI